MEVSVIIPVYNAEPYVRDAVRSALELPEVMEVVLVEDGSQDGTLAACQQLVASDSRVRLIQHPSGVNRGVSASRNLGIRSALHPFVAFLDSDDRFLPERFSAEHAVWDGHPDADGVYGAIGAFFHDAIGRERFEQRFSNPITTVRMALPPEQLFPAFVGLSGVLDFGHFSLDGTTFRRTSLMRMPNLLREDLAMGEDTEFLLRASYHLRLYPGSIVAPVALRGVHAENRVTNDQHRDRSKLRMQEAMLEWADATSLPIAARRLIGMQVAALRCRCAGTWEERKRAIAAILRFPGVLKRTDAVQDLVGMLCGRSNALSRSLQRIVRGLFTLLWRLKGGAPPASRTMASPSPR